MWHTSKLEFNELTKLMASSQVANQRRWDSRVTHVRTNDRCSSLTSVTEHAPPTTSTARSSSRTSKWPKFFILNPTPYFLDFCTLCFFSILLTRQNTWIELNLKPDTTFKQMWHISWSLLQSHNSENMFTWHYVLQWNHSNSIVL